MMPLMTKRFYDALQDALAATDWSVRRVCAEAGVSYEQIKRFMLRAKTDPHASTNVDDAVKLANAMGFTLDELLSDDTAALRSESASLWRKLTPEERDILLAAARGRSAPPPEAAQ